VVIIGVDAHLRTHTLVGVDANGRKLAERTVEATSPGHAQALRWAMLKFGDDDLTWGIEDCRHVSARLENDLLAAGQRVVRVTTNLVKRTRSAARTAGKSDSIDAAAVARAVLREPDLPVATHDKESRELKLLVDRREDLVAQRTATYNRLLWRLHELDPTREPSTLKYAKHRDPLRDWPASLPGLIAELACAEVDDFARLTTAINALEKRITTGVRSEAPNLLAMPGVGGLTAAKIIGEAALVTRFKSEAAFASYAGLAPIPAWSGSTAGRLRRPKSGNRQLNSAMHRIAVTQLRMDCPGRAYHQKRIETGDTPAAARRCLKRRICRTVFGRLQADHRHRNGSTTAA
jgi:transposase